MGLVTVMRRLGSGLSNLLAREFARFKVRETPRVTILAEHRLAHCKWLPLLITLSARLTGWLVYLQTDLLAGLKGAKPDAPNTFCNDN